MACDEALLATARVPVLRIYCWNAPWISGGIFTDRDRAKQTRPDLPFCRRWTGGGVVVHEGDFTYSLTVPRGETLATIKPNQSYLLIHSALAAALRENGVQTGLYGEQSPGAAECFAAAVEYDLVSKSTKIAGGAQRRTRRGLLHQGSVQCEPRPDRGFGLVFARTLAACASQWAPPADFEYLVGKLVSEKYADPAFLEGPRKSKSFTGLAMS